MALKNVVIAKTSKKGTNVKCVMGDNEMLVMQDTTIPTFLLRQMKMMVMSCYCYVIGRYDEPWQGHLDQS